MPDEVLKLLQIAADLPCDDEDYAHDTCRDNFPGTPGLWCASCLVREALKITREVTS